MRTPARKRCWPWGLAPVRTSLLGALAALLILAATTSAGARTSVSPILSSDGSGGAASGGAGSGTPGSSSAVQVVETSADLSRALARQPDLHFRSSHPRGIAVIHVDDRSSYQRVDGFGAAMTDTSSWLLGTKLSARAKDKAIKSLFGPSGIRMNFLRLPMGASDFTKNGTPYSYDDLPRGQTDPKLRHFSVAHDEAYTIPVLRQALALDPRLEILANPWSPPGWMKANDNLNNDHHTGTLLSSAYGPLARYFVKFIKAYARRGVPIADITPQNEPGNGTLYPGLEIGVPGEVKLIGRFLSPALRAAHLQTKIYGGDVAFSSENVRGGHDQSGFVKSILQSPARGALGGIAWHCYFGNPPVMSAVHRLAPRLREIGDECAPGVNPLPMPEVVISEMRNWARVVTFFNIAEDPHKGPVQPPNHGCPGCRGLVTIDEQTGRLRFDADYFYLGQASKFVTPGARRIHSEHFVTYSYIPHHPPHVTSGLDDVAFKNPDGSKVLVAYNTSGSRQRFAVSWQHRSFTYTLAPSAMATFVWH